MANEFKIKNGLVVSGSADIEQDLTVRGKITADQLNISIVSSSVMYESGSTKFGDSADDKHTFTGSVNITGSINLNGQAIGTGKLDETTFNSFTSSYNTVTGSINTRLGSLETFTSSISSNYVSEGEFGTYTGSLNSFTSSTLSSLGALNSASASIRSDFNSFTSSYTNVSSSLDSRIDSLETLSGSFTGSFSGSFRGDGTNLFNIPASGVTGLNLTQIADGSVTASVSNTNGLRVNSKAEITGSLIVTNGITGSIDYSDITNKPTLVSGSVQVDITGTTGYSTFSSSISSSIGSLSSSIATTDSNQNARLDLIETSTGSFNTFTSSASGRLTSLETSTGSLNTFTSSTLTKLDLIQTVTSSLNTFTSSASGRLTSLESTSGSLNTFTSSAIGILTSLESASSSIRTDFNTFTSSASGRLTSLESASSSIRTDFNTFTSSALTRVSAIETATSSLNTFTSSINTTIKSKLDADGVISGSVQVNITGTTGYSTFSSSIATTTLNQSNRLGSIEGKTGSYATTGSNVFQGDQTITGSLYVSQNLIIAGSSSIQHISSSVVNIADNIITVNAQNPSIRFGGLAVIDSGSSPQVSGSILFDSVNDQWIFVHQNQSTVTSSVILMGPETFNNLGGETYLTQNRIPKGSGIEHLRDSNISDTGTNVSINSNTNITGSLLVTSTIVSQTTPLVSGSAQISFNGIIDKPTLVSGSSQVLNGSGVWSGSAQLPAGVVSGSSQVLLSSGVWSGSAQLPSGVVSGSSQVLSGTGIWSGSAQLPSGVVSGSAQVLLSSGIWSGSAQLPSGVVSGSAQTIANLPSGTVSGSSQITLTSGQVTSGLGFTPYNATNPNGYITGINSSAVTTALGYTPYNATNPNGYISGISFANVSSKPTTISGYGITDAITTGNIGSQSVSNASTVANLTPTQFFNNMGQNHSARTSFDASTPSYDFGFRFIQGNTNGPALGGGGQFYSWYLGLGNDYPATGAGSYGMHVAVARGATTPYMSVRYNENNSLGSWIKIAAGYADSAGTATALSSMNISQFTNNSGYLTSITSTNVTTALGYTPYNATNPNGYITGISFANVSSKPTTLSGYGITDAVVSRGTSWNDGTVIGNTVGMLAWKNYGNGHVIFDASAGTSPSGASINNTNPSANWTGTYPTLMGWNGSQTYGVRVDTARYADSAGSAGTATALSSMNISQFTNNSGYATLSGSNSFSNSYNEFGDGTGSVSNDGGWNGRLNLAGSQHARLDVVSVSDGIITTMFSHIGQGVGRVGTMSNHPLSLMVNGSGRVSIDTSGHLLPNSNNAHNLGSPSLGWANVYTNDLHLSNMNKPEGNDVDGTNGTWTIQEGAENLYIINNNNGKKFKISLEEII